MGPLRGLRISRPGLVLLAVVSAVATVVIIHVGLRRTPAQTAALVALAQRTPPRATTTAAAPATGTADAQAPPAPSSGGFANASGGDSGSTDTSTADASTASAAAGSTTDASTSPATDTSTSTSASSSPAPDAGLPSVGHVFLVALSTSGYGDAFGARSSAPYLRSLAHKGALLTNFQSLGHGELADELAMVSGQAPNADTTAGCPTYREYPANASTNSAGIVSGAGCVYPESALTIGDQVTSDGKVWGGYVAAMGKTTCQHPNSNAATNVGISGTEPGYDVAHNPFVFFHSLLDAGDCMNDDHDLGKLSAALATPARTPRFTYVAPDACADAAPVAAASTGAMGTTTTSATTTSAGTTPATTSTPTATTSTPTTSTATTTTTSAGAAPTTSGSDTTTTPAAPPVGCPPGQTSGMAAQDAFLKAWVPKITSSAAYRRNGVLVIALSGTGSAGHAVRTGALVLSHYTPHNTRIGTAYGPYSLLRSIEDMLNDTALAHAATAPSFAKSVLHTST